MANISLLGDKSDHSGEIIDANQTSTTAFGKLVAVQGAKHRCPRTNHGTTPITAITTKSFIEGKLIITEGATAGCGAKIQSPDSAGVQVE